MKTMFNQDLIKILVKESGGNIEYDYSYFKEGFEEWAEKHDASLPDVEQLKEYITGSGYRVIEVTEKDSLDELVDELKDLIGEEFTLSEYVLNLLTETVFYDDVDCDGYCLLDDIEAELEITE